MKILKSLKLKIAYIEFLLIFLYIGLDLLGQILGISGYSDSADEGAMGNRIQRILESLLQGGRIYLWYVVVVLLGILLAYATVRLIAFLHIQETTWFLIMLHVLLYGILFVAYGNFPTKYTDYGFNGINLSTWNQFLLIVLEVAAFPICNWLQKESRVMYPYLSGKKVVVLILLLLYGSFACVGNSLFLSDANVPWTVSPANLTLYVLFAAWLAPYVLGILLLLEKNKEKRRYRSNPEKRMLEGKLLLWASIEILGILLLYFVACNPGNMYVDAIDAFKEIYNLPLSQMSFGFPIAIKAFYKLVFMITPSPVVVTILQIVIAAVMELAVIHMLYLHGVSGKKLLIGTGIFNILPMNGIFVVTFTSNFYYTVACTCMLLIFIREHEEGSNFWKNKVNYVKILLTLLFMALTRNEGMIAAAIIALVLFIKLMVLFRRKMLPILFVFVVGAVALVMSGGMRLLLSKSLSAYATVNADSVNAVAYYNGRVSDTTEYMDIIREEYALYEVGSLTKASYANNYPDRVSYAILHNPDIMLRNRLNKSDCLWDVLENEGIHTAREIIGIYENDMGVIRQNNVLTVALIYMLYPLTIAFCVTDILCYRSGIYLILSFILALYWSKNRMKRGLLLLPAWAHAFVLFLCLLWQCSRHTYPIIVCVVLAFLYTLVADRTKENSEVPVETV
ncbi:MAG: hypothetical protein K5682_08160 [Lachnospiraceae bacterium]|nr:hypothetical protein [Lachnospiraceae bacterium]